MTQCRFWIIRDRHFNWEKGKSNGRNGNEMARIENYPQRFLHFCLSLKQAGVIEDRSKLLDKIKDSVEMFFLHFPFMIFYLQRQNCRKKCTLCKTNCRRDAK